MSWLERYQDPLEIQRVIHGARTIAVVGLSPNELRASNFVGYYLRRHGYRVIPVNPSEPEILGEASYSSLLEVPEPVDVRHMVGSRVTIAERLAHLRSLLRRGSFSFDEAVARADRVTVAVTLYALLELYKQGELSWTQEEPFGEITIDPRRLAVPVPERLSA